MPFLLAVIPVFAGVKNSDCLDCHGDNTLFKTNSAGNAVSLFVDAARLKLSAHQTNTCISCHTAITAKHPDDNKPVVPVNCGLCHARQTESFNSSVHGLALKAGHADAATCRIVTIRMKSFPTTHQLRRFIFAPGGNLRRVPRQGSARLGGERSWSGGQGRLARRADLHGLSRRTQNPLAQGQFGDGDFRGRLQPLPRIQGVEH